MLLKTESIKTGSDIEAVQNLWRKRKPIRMHARKDTSRKQCGRCGGDLHSRDKRPAKDATCHKCHKKGHYSAQCRTKPISEVSSGMILQEAFLDTISNSQMSLYKAYI